MLNWFSNLFSRTTPAAVSAPAQESAAAGPWFLRRWESADTNRVNRAHWQTARGQSINADLAERLKTLRIRCAYEAANNPFVEGVIDTHCVDLVGQNGPSLQVLSDADGYNEALEQIWREWCKHAEITGQSFTELLTCWIRSLWINGEFLTQIVTDMQAEGPVKMRLLDLHPERLDTPAGQAFDPKHALGIDFDSRGKPTRYHIARVQQYGPYATLSLEFDPVPADMILHGFRRTEPGQARGVPWLATSLDPIAELRDFDAEVLDAARSVASLGVVLTSDHPDSVYVEANESTDIERRTMRTAPPGWKFNQIIPGQPAATYVDYRKERQREIGRPVGMPLMTVRLGSEDHNYSSARFDGQVYVRGLGQRQGWLERTAINTLVDQVAREATLSRELPPRPRRVEYGWTWSKPPHVDAKKEADAQTMKLANGTLPYSDALAEDGRDLDTTIRKRKRDQKMLVDAGLPPLPVPATAVAMAQVEAAGDDAPPQSPRKPRREVARA